MIRQAHTYLAGAISGTALIGAAVVAFVLLVSLGALRDWPLAGIGGGGEDATVSEDSSTARFDGSPCSHCDPRCQHGPGRRPGRPVSASHRGDNPSRHWDRACCSQCPLGRCAGRQCPRLESGRQWWWV